MNILKYKFKYPIMKWFNDKSFSGICECGHSFIEHHGGVIVNIKYKYSPRGVGGVLGQECEHNGFNGMIEPDEDGSVCECSNYKDCDWVFKINKNYKYRIDWKNFFKLLL